MKSIIAGIVIALAALVLVGQPFQHVPLGIVSDWTHHNVLYPASNDYAVMARIMRDPRYVQNWYHRHHEAWWPQHHRGPGQSDQGSQRDWSFSLGKGGSVGGQTFPAKFVFDVTATPSCSADYVVTGLAAAGATGQANLVAVNNLYVGTGGLCGVGPSPTVMFAYNVRTGYNVRASVVISLDGKKIAFVDNGAAASNFHVLTWTAGQGTVGAPATPANNVMLALGAATTNTIFVDYQHDAAYATAGTRMYKISPVFNGTPALVTTGGWSSGLNFASAGTLSTPVYDYVTRHIFVEDTGGKVWYADDSGATATANATSWTVATTDTARPPIVDSTNQKIYMYSPNGSAGSVIGQADTSLANGVITTVGAAGGTNYTPLAPDFNNAYYSGNLAGALVYAVGTDNGTNHPALFDIGFTTGWKMNTTMAHGPLDVATNTADASAVTEFYNSSISRDMLFFGVTANCGPTGTTGGCIRSVDITSGFPTNINPAAGNNNAILAASAGTSGITVDNNSSATQASSVYYVTLGTATASTTCPSGNYCLIKATQSALF
jgi:hypothetical protein